MYPKVLERYYKEFALSMRAYVIAVIASSLVLKNVEFPKAAQITIALSPIIPIFFVIVVIIRALRDSDELIQKIQLQAVVFSAITTGLITFSYGFLENIGSPKLPTIWILPMMFAIAFPLVMLLFMLLGLLELVIPLSPEDWSYRHVWYYLPIFYFVGLGIAWRRYK